MKLITRLLVVGMVMANVASSVNAELITIGTATYGGSDYSLIYDVDDQLTWLDYSQPATGAYAGALSWAASLNEPGELTINLDAGYNASWDTAEWRLPSAEGNWGYWGSEQYITSSEMEYLYYNELGNVMNDPSINISPFENIVSGPLNYSWYYLEPNFENSPTYVPGFHFFRGTQSFVTTSVNGGIYAMAVIDGEVTPEPTSLLLLISGLPLLRRRRTC